MFTPPLRRTLLGRTRGRGRLASLAGPWSGEYGYDVPTTRENVPFNAVLGETEGALTGVIDEPNTFGDPGADRLFANVSGRRDGRDVRFTKIYNGAGGVRHSVEYRGEANAAFTRIDGVWQVSWLRGPFYMTRYVATTEADAETEAEAGARD
jgi:hypothetical protein